MAQACPNCGGFDISQEADRFHCLNCGNYFSYDDEKATDGAASEPLFVPEERTEGAQEMPEPTDHDALAAQSATGTEGIDSPAQAVEPGPSVDLDSMTKAEIADHAAAQGVEVSTTQTKDEMIAAVEEAKSG